MIPAVKVFPYNQNQKRKRKKLKYEIIQYIIVFSSFIFFKDKITIVVTTISFYSTVVITL